MFSLNHLHFSPWTSVVDWNIDICEDPSIDIKEKPNFSTKKNFSISNDNDEICIMSVGVNKYRYKTKVRRLRKSKAEMHLSRIFDLSIERQTEEEEKRTSSNICSHTRTKISLLILFSSLYFTYSILEPSVLRSLLRLVFFFFFLLLFFDHRTTKSPRFISS